MAVFYWLPLIVFCLHMVEEFVWPGGFSQWFAMWFPHTKISFTKGYGSFTNGALVAGCVALGLLGPDWSRGPSLWMIVAAILASNAIFHIIGLIKFRAYSPGVVTGTFLSIPLAIAGYTHFISTNQASYKMAVTSVVAGSFFNIWAIVRHKWRAEAIAQRV